ncbi:hypersensitive response-inducing protein [Thozetella sp. PMI_491]|nr:hypersensitive response-inducing protein [Thozetella sp. PMI_491]
MKLTFILAATGASALAVKRYTVFEVSNFTASCIPHSVQCYYSFGVFQPGTMQTEPQHCSAFLTSAGVGQLPDVKEGKCEETSRTFDIVRGDDGLTLTVSQPVSPISNQTASHLIPADELVYAGEPNGVVESYVGPKDFDLE